MDPIRQVARTRTGWHQRLSPKSSIEMLCMHALGFHRMMQETGSDPRKIVAAAALAYSFRPIPIPIINMAATVDGLRRWVLPASAGEFEVVGYSRCAEATSFAFPQLDLILDAGTLVHPHHPATVFAQISPPSGPAPRHFPGEGGRGGSLLPRASASVPGRQDSTT
jgi:hypothetical protein